ncbi:MAG: aminopeptidase N [Thiotrichales bacterium]|nr:aminopeptidase N [Thiotrichales bacterium]
MSFTEPAATRLADYVPPAFLIDEVDLDFELGEGRTLVRARLAVRRNPAAEAVADLVLDGRGLDTRAVRVDGESVSGNRVEMADETLTVRDVPDAFVLETEVAIRPGANKSLEGLYASSGNLCTQCEAEGFRKITWFLDRPDVMARYRTRIVADPRRYPVMLSNGNDVERGDRDDGRRYVVWEDPYPKPSYLFALVAGRLECVEDVFTTRSGRPVTLRIYVQPHNIDRCGHAMRSLQRAMRWDEEVYGLEYDLDTFMVVAVDDFNMGAMENKGLNIFNSAYVLARPDTATDRDFAAIETVIAHEYFHNWTGNRVTCRDWFQLSLKEGLTVFRDQEFSADVASRAVKRIRDVRLLRTHQFAEDAGPMAHPVRPDSYIEIGNFYTVTIYNKGAEVIRMLHTLLGDEAFQAGMRIYFERHDGRAVTTGDFVAAMEAASGMDLEQFRRWYTQAGTPVLRVRGTYDAARSQYVLDIEQSTPATPGQPEKLPLHIPVRIALLDEGGNDIPLHDAAPGLAGDREAVLDVREARRTYRFSNVSSRPVPSLARGFSAPVKIEIERSDDELAFLIARETDPFNRWDAAQEYATRLMLGMIDDRLAGADLDLPDEFVSAMRALLLDDAVDPAFAAEALALPSESSLADRMEIIAVEAIHEVRETVKTTLAHRLEDALAHVHRANLPRGPYRFEAEDAGRRSLKNLCLAYLMQLDDPAGRSNCRYQLETADNMTDALAALACFADACTPDRDDRLEWFEKRWRDDPLVLDKWFSLQATSRLPDTLDRVRKLTRHTGFDIQNPNRVRAVIGAFCHANQRRFHDASGEGYRFLSEHVLAIDAFNPQSAARLLSAASRWRRLDADRGALLRGELERILAASGLSKDCYEVAKKFLA